MIPCARPASADLHTAEGERPLSLQELQAHIERENARLERLGAFSAEEIVVRIEYRCVRRMAVFASGLREAAARRLPDGSIPPHGVLAQCQPWMHLAWQALP